MISGIHSAIQRDFAHFPRFTLFFRVFFTQVTQL